MGGQANKLKVYQLGPMPPPHGGVSTNMLAIHEELIALGHVSKIVDLTNRSGENALPYVLKPRSIFGLLTMLLRGDCDIVHYHIGGNFTFRLALLTLLCGLLPRRKSVVTFHSGGFAREKSENAKRFSIRGAAFRSVDFVIGVNDQMLEMFRRYGVPEQRMMLIPPYKLRAPDESQKLLGSIADFLKIAEPLVISVGALEPEYRNDAIILSFSEILKSFPAAKLVIAGSGSEETSLRALIESENIGPSVLMCGNLEHDQTLKLISRAQILVRFTEYDGDAISVREALHFGTHVIASDNAIRPKGAVLVPDPPALTEAIKMLANKPKSQFSYPSRPVQDSDNEKQVINVYSELVGSSRGDG